MVIVVQPALAFFGRTSAVGVVAALAAVCGGEMTAVGAAGHCLRLEMRAQNPHP